MVVNKWSDVSSLVDIVSSSIQELVTSTFRKACKRKYELVDGHECRNDGKFRKISLDESMDWAKLGQSSYRGGKCLRDVSADSHMDAEIFRGVPATPIEQTTPKMMSTFFEEGLTFPDGPEMETPMTSVAIKPNLKSKLPKSMTLPRKRKVATSMRDIIATLEHPAPEIRVPPSRFIEKPVITPIAVAVPKVAFEPKPRVLKVTQQANTSMENVPMKIVPASRFIMEPAITQKAATMPKVTKKSKVPTMGNATISLLNYAELMD